ncbi:MAG: hypothetical protein ACOC5T_06445 [Elusimicrobiota bacterium]
MGVLQQRYKSRKNASDLDYSNLLGDIGDVVYFHGKIVKKKPYFFQLPDNENDKIEKTYYIVEDQERDKTVVFSSDVDIEADMGDSIYIKGKIVAYSVLFSESVTILDNLTEVSEEEYNNNIFYVDQQMKNFHNKKTGQGISDESRRKSNEFEYHNKDKKYSEGEIIDDEFKIKSIIRGDDRGWRNDLYKFNDHYGNELSSFTSEDIGELGDIVRLTGEIAFNKGYTNIIDIKKLDSSDPPIDMERIKKEREQEKRKQRQNQQQRQMMQKGKYSDGAIVREEFEIVAQKSTRYSPMYILRDPSGFELSIFWGRKNPLGNVGQHVVLEGTIQKRGPYVNLKRAKIITPAYDKTSVYPEDQDQNDDNNISTTNDEEQDQ